MKCLFIKFGTYERIKPYDHSPGDQVPSRERFFRATSRFMWPCVGVCDLLETLHAANDPESLRQVLSLLGAFAGIYYIILYYIILYYIILYCIILYYIILYYIILYYIILYHITNV